MITQEEVIEIIKNYLSEKKIKHLSVSERVQFEEQVVMPYGKYYKKKKDCFTGSYDIPGIYAEPDYVFVTIDAETGEILFLSNHHGYYDA